MSAAKSGTAAESGTVDGGPAEGLDPERGRALLGAMAGRRIPVLGDVFLDEYLVGRAERLSREGPVPVLAFRRRFCLPGGAANPARNIAALGGSARQVGVVGADASAEELRRLLESAGIDASGLVEDAGRPTTQKTRVVAEGLSTPQQVARIDRQPRQPVEGPVEAALSAALERAAADADAILVSHYRSGVVTPALCQVARRLARQRGIWLTVDAQGDLSRFAGFDLVRVGRQDAVATLGRSLDEESDFERACRDLAADLGCRVVLLGRGARGTSLLVEGRDYAVIPPSNVSEVFDVTGAGDSVIAVVSLALAAGAEPIEAVRLANLAAGIVVRRLGVAAPSPAEILAELGVSPS